MSRAVLVSRKETDEERWDRKQQEYMFPTEHGDRHNSQALDRFDGGNATWERKGYRDNPDKFRADYRKQVIKQNVRDEYDFPNADVGHIFSDKNGGSNTRGNVYMQQMNFNRQIGERHDELNAAMVGYERTGKAMDDSKKYGHDFDKGRCASYRAPMPCVPIAPNSAVLLACSLWQAVGLVTLHNPSLTWGRKSGSRSASSPKNRAGSTCARRR